MRYLTACLVALTLPAAASAQFVNGDFQNGTLSGWTVGVTSGGATALQLVIDFDIDGPGPLASTLTAQFSAGRATGVTVGDHGVTLMQPLSLTGGVAYTFDFDWAATRNVAGGNAQGGIFALMVGTTELVRGAAGSTSGSDPHYGHVTGTFTPAISGDYDVGVWILRPFTIPSPTAPNLFQNVDNFTVTTVVPEPAALGAAAAAALAIIRWRRRAAAP